MRAAGSHRHGPVRRLLYHIILYYIIYHIIIIIYHIIIYIYIYNNNNNHYYIYIYIYIYNRSCIQSYSRRRREELGEGRRRPARQLGSRVRGLASVFITGIHYIHTVAKPEARYSLHTYIIIYIYIYIYS